MMTSDSDESDYEDAHQHHDNVVDPLVPEPAVAPHLPPPQPNNQNQIQYIPQPIENEEIQLPPLNLDPIDLDHPDQIQIPDNHEENRDLLMRLIVEYAMRDGNANPNRPRIALDSDSDDDGLGIYSDSDDDQFRDVDGSENRAGAASDDAQDAADMDEDVPEFDQELPIRHAYLGEAMEELQGRVVLEEDATPEIPLIAMGQHLIPGQTLPLQIYHAVFQNAIRRCVLGDRLFGIVHNDMNSLSGNNVIYIGALGTLAEVFEFQEETDAAEQQPPAGGPSTFAVKAKGRQRFNVIEVRRQADGNLMGKVRIRPEIRLQSCVLNVLTPASSRNFLPNQPKEEVEEEEADLPVDRRSSITSISTVNLSAFQQDLKTLQTKIKTQRNRLKYYAAMTPHPYFVYEHYDETVLVEKIHRLLTTELRGLSKSKGKIPMDALDLSFWLAQNLLIDDVHRTKVLKMDCPVERLRWYLELLGKTTKVISCKNCESHIADHSQIFSMSIEGPQGTYVNPHGFVHETLTVYKTKDLVTRGGPSTEASWFPGYSWTIVECRRCKSHIGWKFQAVGRLKPARFWGLARRSVVTKYNFESDNEEENASTFRTPPNSANSNGEGFSTVVLF